MTAAVNVRGLCKSFGGLLVTRSVDLSIEAGERHLLIGPNGAGKTTLFNLIAGSAMPDAGEIWLSGRNITRLRAASRARAGLSRTFQLVTLFNQDTLIHNVILALLACSPLRWRNWGVASKQRRLVGHALLALEIAGLAKKADTPVNQTSYGEKKRVGIAMALAQEPKVLLLDEPFAGLSADERSTIYSMLSSIHRSVTVVMIEHDMNVALSLADNITLLHYGSVVLTGSRRDVVEDPRTRDIYLGHRTP